MTELSDYQRIVERPMIRAYEERVTNLRGLIRHLNAHIEEIYARLEGAKDLPAQMRGRAQFLRDRGEVKSPALLEEAATLLDGLHDCGSASSSRLLEKSHG